MYTIQPPEYYRVTGDNAASPSDVIDALADAVEDAQNRTNRQFGYGQYTELLYVYPNNRVYPSAVPVADVVTGRGQFRVEGNAIWIGWFDPYPVVNVGEVGGVGGFPPQATVTYFGGYQPGEMPIDLRDAICSIAYRRIHPVLTPGLPVGATSPHVGDVGYGTSGSISAVSPSVDESVEAVLARHARRQVRPFHR